MSKVVNLPAKADRAYAHYHKDKGTAALIAWFKEELALNPPEADNHRNHGEDLLCKHARHVEKLALSWRESRHVKLVVAVA